RSPLPSAATSAFGRSPSHSDAGTTSVIDFRNKYPELYPTLKLHYEASQATAPIMSPITHQTPKIEPYEQTSPLTAGGAVTFSAPSSSLSTPEFNHNNSATLVLNDINNLVYAKKAVSAGDIDKTKSFHDVSKESSPME